MSMKIFMDYTVDSFVVLLSGDAAKNKTGTTNVHICHKLEDAEKTSVVVYS